MRRATASTTILDECTQNSIDIIKALRLEFRVSFTILFELQMSEAVEAQADKLWQGPGQP